MSRMRLLLCRSFSASRFPGASFWPARPAVAFILNPRFFGLESLLISFGCFSFELRPLVIAVCATRCAPALHILAWVRTAFCAAAAPPAGGLAPLRDLMLQLLKLFGFGLGIAGVEDSGHVFSSGYQAKENRISSRAFAAAFAARAFVRAI